MNFPRSRNGEKVICYFFKTLFNPRLTILPRHAPQLIQRNLRIGSTITRKHFNILNRNKELVPSLVNNFKAIMRISPHIKGFQALITTNSMFNVHNKITHLKAGNYLNKKITMLFGLERTANALS